MAINGVGLELPPAKRPQNGSIYGARRAVLRRTLRPSTLLRQAPPDPVVEQVTVPVLAGRQSAVPITHGEHGSTGGKPLHKLLDDRALCHADVRQVGLLLALV